MLKTPHVRWACLHKYIYKKFAYAIKKCTHCKQRCVNKKKIDRIMYELVERFWLLLLLLLFLVVVVVVTVCVYIEIFAYIVVLILLLVCSNIYTLCMVYIPKAFSSIFKRLF